MADRTKEERRDERRRKERERMATHGAGLRRVYRDAILKRLRGIRLRRGEQEERPS